MAAAAAVAQEVDAMIGADGNISADMISEDSLIASSPSPEAPRKQRRTSRSPSIGKFVSMRRHAGHEDRQGAGQLSAERSRAPAVSRC